MASVSSVAVICPACGKSFGSDRRAVDRFRHHLDTAHSARDSHELRRQQRMARELVSDEPPSSQAADTFSPISHLCGHYYVVLQLVPLMAW